MANYLFRGEDRRLLAKAEKVLSAIVNRDNVALNSKKTTRISTRTLMLDYNQSPDPLYTAAQALITQFNNLLALPKST